MNKLLLICFSLSIVISDLKTENISSVFDPNEVIPEVSDILNRTFLTPDSFNATGNETKENDSFDGIHILDIETTTEFSTSTSPKFDENEVFPEIHNLEDLTLANSTLGYIRGRSIVSANGKPVDEYLGIPFAEPPVGLLRFRKPVPKIPWSGVYNAWIASNSCMQIIDTYLGDFAGATTWNANTQLSEDCLYLNIWVPKPRPVNAPVMIWIYGGGFFSGSNTLDIYNGSILASEEGIIVVSMQYRLGPFGFFYLGNEEAPGNQGLHDQTLALKWIQDNIANFGGHPKYVTLFGQSAGAACVGLHLLSPKSSPLFMQAILQSGAPTADWVSVNREVALNRSIEFANRLDCPSEQLEAVECLRKVDAQVLVDDIPATGNVFDYYFIPVVDGDFLLASPIETIKYGGFKRTNILLGTTSNEGASFLVYIFPEIFQLHNDITLRRADFTEGVFKLFPNMSKLELEALMFQYTDWTKPNESPSLIDNLEKMIGEKCITCDTNQLASAYSATDAGVFMYEFAHRSSNTPWPDWVGVPHNHEIQYVFGRPLNSEYNYLESEKNLSRRIMNYWANFARTGNPSLSNSGEFLRRFWPVHTITGKEYLRISVEQEEVRHGLRASYCAFWKEFLPELSKILREMEAAIARGICSDSNEKNDLQRTHSAEVPDLLEIEDEWAMEFQDWKRDHSEWKKEFAKYKDVLETSRRLMSGRGNNEL